MAQLLSADLTNRGLVLDPRSKLALMLSIVFFTMGGVGSDIKAVILISKLLGLIPIILLLTAKQWKKALAYGDFDFVLASVHNLRGVQDFYFLDYSTVDIPSLLHAYFDELAETAAFPHFDSLSHLTYPLRYIVEREGYYPDLTPYREQIDRIFNILIKNNKALEINVSGLFKPIGRTLPDLPLVSRFRRLGGEYITLGTDAHNADMVGKGLEQGAEVARQAGFTHYTVFANHQPQLLPLS